LSKIYLTAIDLSDAELKQAALPFESSTGPESQGKTEYIQTFFNRIRMELTQQKNLEGKLETVIVLFDHKILNGVDSPIKPSVSFLIFETFENPQEGYRAKIRLG